LINFPEKGAGFVRYGPNDSKGDHWVNPELASILFGVGKMREDNGQNPMQIGDISGADGLSPNASHKSHKGGNNVDLRLIRNDEKNLPVNVNDPNFSMEKSQELVNQLTYFGVTNILSFPNISGQMLKDTTQYKGHKDHLHISNHTLSNPVITLPEVIVKPN
jgi:hypothetical protein